MTPSKICVLFAFILYFISSDAKSIDDWDRKRGKLQTPVGKSEIEEVANRDYDTAHGRILAVNLAHRRRRATLTNTSRNGTARNNDTATVNAFQQIEKANKDISNYYQGDIDLEGDIEMQEFIRTKGNSRNAVRSRRRLWTSRIIPLRIPPRMSHVAANVRLAMNEFHSKTCLRFVYYVPGVHKNYIEFTDHNGCASKVGKKYFEPGRQTISLGDGCNFFGTVLHEMTHAVGFWHEQARSDRDRYVKIYWENILEGFADQFDKYDWRDIDQLGVSYDYQSIMHYDRKAWTKNGKPTIVAIGNEGMKFGTPDYKLSKRDAIEINALYDCKTKSYGWSSWAAWTPCDDDCFRVRERFCFNSGNVEACRGSHIANIYGVDKQRQKCPSSICPAPIDGHWGHWSEWGGCSKTCNDGARIRSRKCNNPKPNHNGKPCPANAEERKSCILKRCHLDADDTDFENFRLGMWWNSRADSLDWQFNKGITQTVDTGPMKDHTSGSGYYLYVESSAGQARPSQYAHLVSPWLPARDEGQCLKFYYTMYGKTMGSLIVKLELVNGIKWWIFLKRGNQGMEWKKGMGNIDVPNGMKYRLTIEAKIGQTGYSDIAIDDVYIDPGLCNCQDDYFSCSIWVAGDHDIRCSSNSMKKSCKRSCGVCGTPPPSCEDGDKIQCPLWAKGGECQKNPAWMKKNCRKSCKTCNCDDKNDQCPAWAKKGECKKNPRYTLPNCKWSCGQCK